MPGVKGKKSLEHVAKLRAFLKEHNKRLGELKRGKKRPEVSGPRAGPWKGGRNRTKRGYILIWKPDHPNCNKNSYVFEHRLVMEKTLGRYLTKLEVVHHENGNKQDNRIENLRLMTNPTHISMEQTEDMSNRVCLICNSHKTRRRDWYRRDNGFICHRCYDRENARDRRRRKRLEKSRTTGNYYNQ